MASLTLTTDDSTFIKKPGADLLLVIFIHGFKGTDETFKEFPQRLEHVLSETVDNIAVESIIFPAYETKGDLTAAVIRFADWLTTLTVQRENQSGGGAGSARIVICGHSMGGYLAADSLLEFIKTRPDHDCPLWPRIIACVTFDTPVRATVGFDTGISELRTQFLGINPAVVKHGVTKAAEYANTATTVGSAIFGSFAGLGAQKFTEARTTTTTNSSASTSVWGKWAPAAFAVGGALMAGAAAGGAYYKRDDLNQGYSWLMDHMKYVGNIWDEPGLRRRVDGLIDLQENHSIFFRNFYVHLPEAPPIHLTARTFIAPPKRTAREWQHFTAVKNGRAVDEVQGHTSMFNAKMNDGYYGLGLEVANVIQQAIQASRGIGSPELKAVSEKGSRT